MTLAEAKERVSELTARQDQIKATIDALIPESSRIAAQLRELTALSRAARQELVEAITIRGQLEAEESARIRAEEEEAARLAAEQAEQEQAEQAEQPTAE